MARVNHTYSSAVHAAIARRFCAPRWATFFEVRDDAGFKAQRTADAISVATWTSMGLAIHGFEVKRSRADFLRELKQPEKSSTIIRYCDRWWIAVDDDKIAKPSEIPETWGLMVRRGKTLVTVKEAPKLSPTSLDRGFVAALLRRATEHVTPNAIVSEKVEEIREEERARERRYSPATEEAARFKRSWEDLRAAVDAFEKASGIKIDSFRFGQPAALGALLANIMNRGVMVPHTEHAENAYEEAAKKLREIRGLADTVNKELERMKRGASEGV